MRLEPLPERHAIRVHSTPIKSVFTKVMGQRDKCFYGLTNKHVVNGRNKLVVFTVEGSSSDPYLDISFVQKVKGQHFHGVVGWFCSHSPVLAGRTVWPCLGMIFRLSKLRSV